MFKKRCYACNEKVEKKFNYCPKCGASFKTQDKEEFGMLGKGDDFEEVQEVMKLPMGMDKIMNSLVRQLEKELKDLDRINPGSVPRGIRINVSAGKPQMRQVIRKEPEKSQTEQLKSLSEEEIQRRINLPKENAESKVRRLADRIIYEINIPGVKAKEDVSITRLATGFEIKAYSKNKCYVKFIPLSVEIIRYSVREEKLFLELRT